MTTPVQYSQQPTVWYLAICCTGSNAEWTSRKSSCLDLELVMHVRLCVCTCRTSDMCSKLQSCSGRTLQNLVALVGGWAVIVISGFKAFHYDRKTSVREAAGLLLEPARLQVRLQGCRAARLHGCKAAGLQGGMAARLHGCMAARMHGCKAAWHGKHRNMPLPNCREAGHSKIMCNSSATATLPQRVQTLLALATC